MALNITTHRNLLLKILKDIYSDTALGPVLGFKGGTAAYFFYDLPRFSVDLDFDLLDTGKKEDEVFRKIEKIIGKYGIIRGQYKKRNTLFFMLAYDDVNHNIKVEISRRGHSASYELKNYLGISMLVMAKADMAANKLLALLNRTSAASRDIYDVWFCLQNIWPINEEIIKERSGISFKNYLKKCIAFVEKYNDKYILQGMGELLTEKQKAWVKADLKNETVFLLKVLLDGKK